MISNKEIYDLFLKSTGISTDSRKVKPGNIFFALSGNNFNGNKFAIDALTLGAEYAVIDDPSFNLNNRTLLVYDSLASLQEIARIHRKNLNIPVIGITGSNGKTTTKELMHSVFATKLSTFATTGNLNNHIGVPLSVLSINRTHEIAIIEMGANHIGEIAFLSGISMPDYGLITNIGKAHLEGFGSVEGIKIGKGELYRSLESSGGTAFLNSRLDYLYEMAGNNLNIISFGEKKNDDFHMVDCSDSNEASIILYTNSVQTHIHSQLKGSYNAMNMMAAASIGLYFKISPAEIKKAIEEYAPSNNRSQTIIQGSNTFILDAYNANPTSMRMALESFAKLKGQTRIAILGDMLELGNYSREEHSRIAQLTKELNIDEVILVGPLFGELSDKGFTCFSDSDQASAWLLQRKPKNAVILLKGSRGLKIEKVLDSYLQVDSKE